MATASRTAERAALSPTAQPALVQHLLFLLLGGVMLGAVAAVGLLQVSQTSRVTTIGYELRALEIERSALAARVRLLEAEIAGIARIDQVRHEAVTRLGMTEPEQTLRIAVAVPAPRVIPMPERYVVVEPAPERGAGAWWEQFLRRLPGFE